MTTPAARLLGSAVRPRGQTDPAGGAAHARVPAGNHLGARPRRCPWPLSRAARPPARADAESPVGGTPLSRPPRAGIRRHLQLSLRPDARRDQLACRTGAAAGRGQAQDVRRAAIAPRAAPAVKKSSQVSCAPPTSAGSTPPRSSRRCSRPQVRRFRSRSGRSPRYTDPLNKDGARRGPVAAGGFGPHLTIQVKAGVGSERDHATGFRDVRLNDIDARVPPTLEIHGVGLSRRTDLFARIHFAECRSGFKMSRKPVIRRL